MFAARSGGEPTNFVVCEAITTHSEKSAVYAGNAGRGPNPGMRRRMPGARPYTSCSRGFHMRISRKGSPAGAGAANTMARSTARARAMLPSCAGPLAPPRAERHHTGVRMRDRASSSPNQTFVLFPLAVLAFDVLVRRRVRLDPRWAPLLAAGYALYRTAGDHRERRHAGPRGFEKPPVRLVTDGPYAYTRNPMYLGHLIFSAALVGATRSPLAMLFALRQALRFGDRVARDEDRLERLFGGEYRSYMDRVPRWFGLPRMSSVHGTAVTTNDSSQPRARDGG